MLIYMKHPVLGNEHVKASEQKQREAAGWVRWPRTPEQKAPAILPPVEVEEVAEIVAPEKIAPPKRKPGRPKK